MGGLSKKAHILEKTIKENNKPALLVDAGALLFDRPRLSPGTEQQAQINATGIVEAYNAMHYDAVAVSGQELAAGLSFLLALKEKSQFTWLSANLVRKSTNQPLFASSLIKKIGNLKVGITALTSPEEPGILTQSDDAMIMAWEQTLPAVIKQLAGSADMIILLSSLPAHLNTDITKLHPEIHIIVQAEQRSANMPPQLQNKTLICQTAKQGKYLGLLQFSWSKSKVWGDDKNTMIIDKSREIDQLVWQIKGYKSRGEPEVVYKDDRSHLEIYHNLVRQKEALVKEVNTLKSVMEQERARGTAAGSFTNDFIELDAGLPNHPKVHAIIQQTKERINSLGRRQSSIAPQRALEPLPSLSAPSDTAAAGGSLFAGWMACAGCHAENVNGWQGNGHAHAYQSLVSSEQQFNLNCLPCHVTDKGADGTDHLLDLSADLKAVGCEACHGAGRRHADDPGKWQVVAKPTADTCTRCHTQERDNTFDYASAVSRIACARTEIVAN